jgi:hypothetical protein
MLFPHQLTEARLRSANTLHYFICGQAKEISVDYRHTQSLLCFREGGKIGDSKMSLLESPGRGIVCRWRN